MSRIPPCFHLLQTEPDNTSRRLRQNVRKNISADRHLQKRTDQQIS